MMVLACRCLAMHVSPSWLAVYTVLYEKMCVCMNAYVQPRVFLILQETFRASQITSSFVSQRKEVLEVIKETVLGQLNEKCPSHVSELVCWLVA